MMAETGKAPQDLAAAPPPTGPLNGIKVVDLSRVLAGPFCTLLLNDLGAQIIKVEQPGKGDDSREIGPFLNGKSAYFASANRGKASIALNLKDRADIDTFHRLLAGADVLVENYRPGTMERLGLGWEQLQEQHPHLVYCGVSGFGKTGPYSERPAYDLIAQAMGGIMSLTGHGKGEPPTRVGTSLGDLAGALFATIGIMAALQDRARTGLGQLVDIALLDCQVALLENAIVRYGVTGKPPAPIGSRHPSITPFQAYRTADDPIVIAAGNDQLFKAMCDAIGCPELFDDPRYATNATRTEHVDEIESQIETILRAKPARHWLEILIDAGVPSGPINSVDKVLVDPQIRAREMVIKGTGLGGEPLELAGNPIKLSRYDESGSRRPAPQLDGDRDAILAWLDRLEDKA